MSLIIILKVTKNQGFTVSLENMILEKWKELGGQMDPSVFLRLTPISSYVMVNEILTLFMKD